MVEERGEKVERPTLKVAAEIGADRAERIKESEAAAGVTAAKDTGRIPADIEKGKR